MNTETYVPISKLEHGNNYEQVFLIKEVKSTERMLSSGVRFARVTLKDITGTIEGAVWNYRGDLEEGMYVRMKLETQTYRDALEFQAQSDNINVLENPPINQHDYVQGVSEGILTQYAHAIEDIIGYMNDPVYRNIMSNAVHSLELLHILKESPYGINGPMAYKGGLLVHTAHALEFVLAANKQAASLEIPFSSSLTIAGCILKNIGWHTTTRFQDDVLRTRDAFYTIGIERSSARFIDHLLLTCESDLQITIDESKRQALENMCDNRTRVCTLEGRIVGYADDMASTLGFGAAILQQKHKGSWSNELFVGHLGIK